VGGDVINMGQIRRAPLSGPALLSGSSAQIQSVDAARRPLRAFPAKAGIHFCRGTGFCRCSGFDMSDRASLPDESCE
jgi:hypothetical protein